MRRIWTARDAAGRFVLSSQRPESLLTFVRRLLAWRLHDDVMSISGRRP